MPLPTMEGMLIQRSRRAVEPTPLQRAATFLHRVDPSGYWDPLSLWRNGFILLSLLAVQPSTLSIPAQTLRAATSVFLDCQRPDGSWVDPEAPDRPDASITAMGVLVLSTVDRTAFDSAINRGVDWLLSNQSPDGTWTSDTSAMDDVVADTLIIIKALERSGRQDAETPVAKANRFVRPYVSDDYLASDRCRPVNAFIISWLVPNGARPKTDARYYEALLAPATLESPLELARALTIVLVCGRSPYDRAVQTALGRLLMLQHPDGSWPGTTSRNAAYMTAHMLHALPHCLYHICLAECVEDIEHLEQTRESDTQARVEKISQEALRRTEQFEKDKAIMEQRLRSIESERDMYRQMHMFHIEQHKKQIEAVGRLSAIEEEAARLRQEVDKGQREAGRWQTYFWFVFGITMSIITGFVVNVVTSRI